MSTTDQYKTGKVTKAIITVIKLDNGIDCIIGAPDAEQLKECLTEINPDFKYSVDKFHTGEVLSRGRVEL